MTNRQAAIRQQAARLGIGVRTSGHGDCIRRYRFETVEGDRDLSPVLLGAGQAEVWLNGYFQGRAWRKKS